MLQFSVLGIFLTNYMFFQGILYIIVIYGLAVLRVCYGPLPIFLCNIAVFLSGFAILFVAITVTMYTFTRFMFVCIWKRMRQMDDNLIVGIATIQAIVLSLFFTAASWLKLHGQGMGHQVSFSFVCKVGSHFDDCKSQYIDIPYFRE